MKLRWARRAWYSREIVLKEITPKQRTWSVIRFNHPEDDGREREIAAFTDYLEAVRCATTPQLVGFLREIVKAESLPPGAKSPASRLLDRIDPLELIPDDRPSLPTDLPEPKWDDDVIPFL